MSARQVQVSIEPIQDVPETASVCHFDELDAVLQEALAAARRQDSSAVTVDDSKASLADDCMCDVVKFTEYYRVNSL